MCRPSIIYLLHAQMAECHKEQNCTPRVLGTFKPSPGQWPTVPSSKPVPWLLAPELCRQLPAGTVAGTWRSCQKCLIATYSCHSAICADGRDKLYFVKYISERQRLWKFNLLLNNFPQDGHQELMVTEHGIVVIVPVKARLYFQRVLIPRKIWGTKD